MLRTNHAWEPTLTHREQRIFCTELLKDIRQSILDDIGKVPEAWDGQELGMWIAERTKRYASAGESLQGRRLKDYENEVLVRNL